MASRIFVCSLLLAAACNHTPPSGGAPSSANAPASVAPVASAAPSASAAEAGARQSDVVSTPSGDVRITPLHHATFLLELAGKAVYFDPVKDASYDGLPKATAIFLTDIHPDHLDAATIAELSDAETVIIAPQAVADKLPKSVKNVRVMKNGETTTTKALIVPAIPSLGVEAVAMYNKIRGPEPGKPYHEKGRGNGYVLSFGGKRIYVSGDTECTDEMKALRNIDIAFVCMNLPYTMPPVEAGSCIAAFQPKIVYPYHYRGSDPSEVRRALEGKPVEVRLRKWY
jgi:L-ascorbate metabolism protein UlaG (beta-lactamase superfamily)